MKTNAVAMVATYLVLEAVWFAVAIPRIYSPLFAAVQGSPAVYRPLYALPAYAILTYGLWVLVVSKARDRLSAALDATAFALAVYGVYNLTNLATLRMYPLWAACVDTAWGVTVTNVATQLSIAAV